MISGLTSAVLSFAAVPGLVNAIILVLLVFDAFVPVVPAQALMIGGGILTASGELKLALVVAAGALGAYLGDLACFALGRQLGRVRAGREPVERTGVLHRLARRITGMMGRHVFLAMLLCRFVPAGRMVASANAGKSGYTWRRFLGIDLLATTVWAT